MKVSFFIDRPVFSAVISIVIVIVGIIGLTMLPVDQYPQITPPVVKISASYPGASALTLSQAVATPIEQEINGTPGMRYPADLPVLSYPVSTYGNLPQQLSLLQRVLFPLPRYSLLPVLTQ